MALHSRFKNYGQVVTEYGPSWPHSIGSKTMARGKHFSTVYTTVQHCSSMSVPKLRYDQRITAHHGSAPSVPKLWPDDSTAVLFSFLHVTQHCRFQIYGQRRTMYSILFTVYTVGFKTIASQRTGLQCCR